MVHEKLVAATSTTHLRWVPTYCIFVKWKKDNHPHPTTGNAKKQVASQFSISCVTLLILAFVFVLALMAAFWKASLASDLFSNFCSFTLEALIRKPLSMLVSACTGTHRIPLRVGSFWTCIFSSLQT